MEGYPFGHHHHHEHHNPRDGEEYPPPAPPPSFRDDGPPPPPSFRDDGPPPPPPPSYYGDYDPPPPPQVNPHHPAYHSGSGGGGSYDAPPISDFHSQPPPSQNFNYSSSGHGYPSQQPADRTEYTTVVHHERVESEGHHSYRPHLPSFLHHHEHQQGSAAGKPTVRVFTKAEANYSLTVRDGKVILAPSNPSDPFQHWIKDEKYSTKVKDEEGFPSFALVNKATGQAMKHSIGATHPVQLIPYNPDVLDESVLWTESKDLGDSYRTVRMVNNIRLNVDALNGDKNHGGVREGTTVVLWEWKKGDNQRWKIIPY
ncbi:ricin B-like lectin EULS3 isoform X2 [Rhododendron vialii]|nr:ricin B-like lectin EULS3 isoform X2 [Rhododendron vialii]